MPRIEQLDVVSRVGQSSGSGSTDAAIAVVADAVD
jgi:hypothetical protein